MKSRKIVVKKPTVYRFNDTVHIKEAKLTGKIIAVSEQKDRSIIYSVAITAKGKSPDLVVCHASHIRLVKSNGGNIADVGFIKNSLGQNVFIIAIHRVGTIVGVTRCLNGKTTLGVDYKIEERVLSGTFYNQDLINL